MDIEKALSAHLSDFSTASFLFKDEYGEVKNPQSELEDFTEEVKVTHVIDGNTVEIINENDDTETIRLLLIDTPDSEDPRFGEQVSEFTKIRLEDSTVLLEWGETDEDGRTLGYIWLKNGINRVNFAELIPVEGLARISHEAEPNPKYLEDFKAWEQEAKDAKLNIWSVDGYVINSGFDTSVVQ